VTYAFRKYLNVFLTSIALVIVFLLIRNIGGRQFLYSITLINWKFSLIAFVLYLAVSTLKAVRFQVLVGTHVNILALLRIVFLQNFFNLILPFKIGDLTYVHLLHQRSQVKLGKNIASLISSRIFDFLSLILIFSGVVFATNSQARIATLHLTPITTGVFIFFLILLGIFIFASRWLVRLFVAGINWLRLQDNRFIYTLIEKLREFSSAFAELRTNVMFVNVASLSLLIWFLTFIIGIFMFRSVGLTLPNGLALFAYAFPILIGLLPLFIIGNLGFYEGSVIFGLFLVGISRDQAILTSLLLHMQEILFVLTVAIISIGMPKIFKYVSIA